MARANRQWQQPGAFDSTDEALVIFSGAHSYISPSWYEQAPAVPTWNYSVVHAYGVPRVVRGEAGVLELLADESAFFESELEQPWSTASLPSDWLRKMAGGVVAFEIEITRIEAKAKLSQNRPGDQPRIASELERSGDAMGAAVARAIRASQA